jgi:hypothetical protein
MCTVYNILSNRSDHFHRNVKVYKQGEGEENRKYIIEIRD